MTAVSIVARTGIRAILDYDWAVTGSGTRLHSLIELENPKDFDDNRRGLAKAACGRRDVFLIPGIGSRMCYPRCERCCKATGLPEGVGSPKNDDACRAIKGWTK